MAIVTRAGKGSELTHNELDENFNWLNANKAANVKPAFVANAAVTTCWASTHTKIIFNAIVHDSNNNFDATTNYRFTPTVAGYYQFNLSVLMDIPATNRLVAQIYKNGSVEVANYAVGTAAGGSSSVSGVIFMNGITDYVEGYVYQDTVGSVNTSSVASLTRFSGGMIS